MEVLLGMALVVLSASAAERAKAAEDQATSPIALETAADRLLLDRASGRLLSMRAKRAPDVELIATASDHPTFALDYLAADRQYRRFDSRDAKNVSVSSSMAVCSVRRTLRG
jgi:hypothetical protein